MLGISGGDPSFRDDDGSADPSAAVALAAFAAGEGSEHAVLTALADGRLLVPVVAVLAEQIARSGSAQAGPGGPGGQHRDTDLAGQAEKTSEMAMPTLIGIDGRRAVPAFSCLESLRRWQADARPVPVAARLVWRAACEESCAVVVDVAGPVPLAVEGARLAALARGGAAPLPQEDPDVREAVAAVLAGELAVAAFRLGPGDADRDLTIGLVMAPDGAGCDIPELAQRVGDAVMARLGSRLRRGIAIALGSPQAD
ncbi:MAG TPA: SseB family protein [Streptosporangiaceae bacterium]|nr:SseB family protein [Streptosporangiaceae bacterium]